MDKIYFENYIFSFNDLNSYLQSLCDMYSDKINKSIPIGYTNFRYPINNYTIGNGPNHTVLIATTHGCEIVTTYFILEFITTLLKDDELYNKYKDIYTFNIIPVLNPEGFVVSSSNVLANIHNLNISQIEELSKTYLNKYNSDDINATKSLKFEKKHRTVLKSSLDNICNINLAKYVSHILKNTKLSPSVLPTWSANGLGIDPNSNSIHRFACMLALRKKQKYANLRYNDIPVTMPSPMSYPGTCSLSKSCPENLYLHRYLTTLYKHICMDKKKKLIAVFSFHSTGGQIYGFPDKNYASKKQIKIHLVAMNKYSQLTGYEKMDEELKYGVMDFYRLYLENTATLTIELSELNANPIGPFSDISSLNLEIIKNKEAVFKTLDYLRNII